MGFQNFKVATMSKWMQWMCMYAYLGICMDAWRVCPFGKFGQHFGANGRSQRIFHKNVQFWPKCLCMAPLLLAIWFESPVPSWLLSRFVDTTDRKIQNVQFKIVKW